MTRVIIATPAGERGGVWKHVLDLAAGYRARGIQTAVALPEYATTDMWDEARDAGLHTMTLAQSVTAPADVWHLHLAKSLEWPALRWNWRAKLVRGRVTVVTEHLPRVPGTDPLLPWEPSTPPAFQKPGAKHAKTLLKKLMMAPVDRVITVSEHSREFLHQRYGIPLSKITAVPNGVPSGLPASLPPALSEALGVITVGSLTWRKGFDVLLTAAALARHPWHIDVIGDGPERSVLEKMAADLDMVTVTFHGWRDGASTASASADVLCLPSRSEAMPYAVLEAMACGRPVVASAVDGVPELVADGVSGTLVAPEDPAALASALDELAEQPELRMSMGAAARTRLETGFTVSLMVDRTLAAYGIG